MIRHALVKEAEVEVGWRARDYGLTVETPIFKQRGNLYKKASVVTRRITNF
jgi:hypothetical protein